MKVRNYLLCALLFGPAIRAFACSCPEGYVPKDESEFSVMKTGYATEEATQAAGIAAAKSDATSQILVDSAWDVVKEDCENESPEGLFFRRAVVPIDPSDLSCGENSGSTWDCSITMVQSSVCCVPASFKR